MKQTDKAPCAHLEQMQPAKKVIEAYLDSEDPLGSYTGNAPEAQEPTQDADDL